WMASSAPVTSFGTSSVSPPPKGPCRRHGCVRSNRSTVGSGVRISSYEHWFGRGSPPEAAGRCRGGRRSCRHGPRKGQCQSAKSPSTATAQRSGISHGRLDGQRLSARQMGKGNEEIHLARVTQREPDGQRPAAREGSAPWLQELAVGLTSREVALSQAYRSESRARYTIERMYRPPVKCQMSRISTPTGDGLRGTSTTT